MSIEQVNAQPVLFKQPFSHKTVERRFTLNAVDALDPYRQRFGADDWDNLPKPHSFSQAVNGATQRWRGLHRAPVDARHVVPDFKSSEAEPHSALPMWKISAEMRG